MIGKQKSCLRKRRLLAEIFDRFFDCDDELYRGFKYASLIKSMMEW